jgi:hypothetical protein
MIPRQLLIKIIFSHQTKLYVLHLLNMILIVLDSTDVVAEIDKKETPSDLLSVSEFNVEIDNPSAKEDK